MAGLILGLVACVTTSSPRQIAYNACTDVNNQTFRFLKREKAMVVGVSGSTTRCFWAWEYATLEAAQQSAFANCRKSYSDCYLWANSAGLAPWVQRISDNGGTDPDARSSGSGSAFLAGMAQGMAAASGYYVPSYNLPTASYQAPAPTPSSDNCQPLPPRCARASSNGEQLLARFPQTTGIVDSASQTYCAMLVGIEVNSFCAKEYRAAGRHSCAALVDQQVAEYNRGLYEAQRVVDAASISRIRQACVWQY